MIHLNYFIVIKRLITYLCLVSAILKGRNDGINMVVTNVVLTIVTVRNIVVMRYCLLNTCIDQLSELIPHKLPVNYCKH